MNNFLGIPLELRLVLVFAIGVCAGGVVNWAVCVFAYAPRTISPWSSASFSPRRPIDFVPIVGWLSLRGRTSIGHTWLWLRPLIVELSCGAALAALYYWETVEFALLPVGGAAWVMRPAGFIGTTNIALAVHLQFIAHAILAMFMLAASLVDIDERNIPDGISVPGTLVGLFLAAAYPWSLPTPEAVWFPGTPPEIDFLKITSPVRIAWPPMLGPMPNGTSLALGIACYLLWCAALLPRPWRTRRGLRVAVRLLGARMWQGLFYRPYGPWFRPMLGLIVLGLGGITAVWVVGGPNWIALLSALVGMVVGGGMVWIVRQIGFFALGREAMGFGDVTLMAMMGSFLGWQTCILIFFLAPLLALGWAILQLLRSGDHELFYGPFLCLAAGLVVVRWVDVWEWAARIFGMGWFVPAVLALAFVLMALMLAGLRWLRTSPNPS